MITRSLQIVDSLGMGGAETWLMEALRIWSRNGSHKADFLLTGGRPGLFDEEARALGARTFYQRYTRATLVDFIRAFRGVLRTGRYDAIHDHQDYASGWHFLFGTGYLPPVRIAHVHNPKLHITENYATGPVRRLTTDLGRHLVGQLATHVCGTSVEILKEYKFDPCSKAPAVSALYCGFDVSKFSRHPEVDRASVRQEFGWPNDSRIVLMVGRLDQALQFDHPKNHKNTWFGLNVARLAAEKEPNVRLLVVGEGDSRNALQVAVNGWSLSHQFRLVGIRHDVPRLMRAADVLLFPSRQEGLGMAAVEAQAASLPVLASTAVPQECIVIPELYHALPLGSSINEWADVLLSVAASARIPFEASRMMFQGGHFSIEESVKRLEMIYRGK